MTAPQARPRVVDVAFWMSVVGAVLLIAGGLLRATTSLTMPVSNAQQRSAPLEVGLGALFIIAGCVLGFLCGRTRNGDKRFRRALAALAIVVVLLTFALVITGLYIYVAPLAVFGVIPVAVGATLFTRPGAEVWFDAKGGLENPDG